MIGWNEDKDNLGITMTLNCIGILDGDGIEDLVIALNRLPRALRAKLIKDTIKQASAKSKRIKSARCKGKQSPYLKQHF